jgi:hypothetical protein
MQTAKLRFHHLGATARIDLERDGRWTTAVPDMPACDVEHELGHAAVETSFGVAGFLTLIAEGTAAKLAREAGDLMALRAEVLVELVTSSRSRPAAEHLERACARWGVPPFPVAAWRWDEARLRFEDLRARWLRLSRGASLDVELAVRPRLRAAGPHAPQSD